MATTDKLNEKNIYSVRKFMYAFYNDFFFIDEGLLDKWFEYRRLFYITYFTVRSIYTQGDPFKVLQGQI